MSVNQLQEKALQYLETFEKFAEQHSQTVIDTSLTVIRVNSFGSLATGFALAGIAVIAYRTARTGLLSKGETELEEIINAAKFFVSSLVAAILGPLSGVYLLNIWNWVGAIEPKLYIAYKLLGKLL